MCVRLGQGHGVVLAPCMAAGPGPCVTPPPAQRGDRKDVPSLAQSSGWGHPTKGTPKLGGITQCCAQIGARRGFSTSSVLRGSQCLMKLGANGDI